MSRWLEQEDAAAVVVEEDEPVSLWAGPLGMTIRFGVFALAIFGLYLGVRATSHPIGDRRDTESRIADANPVTTASLPSSTPPAIPVIQMTPPRPVQGPDLPRRMLLEPQAFCSLIDVDKGASKWRRSPVYPDEWECMSSRSAPGSPKSSPPDAPPDDYSVFAMARGVGKGNIRHVRFKLSASSPAGIETASNVALDRLERLFKELNWPLPEHVSLAIRLQNPFSIREQGTTFQFLKERMSASSYNLIITFPKPAKVPSPAPTAKSPTEPEKVPTASPRT